MDVARGDTTKISNDGVEDYVRFRDTTENRRQLNALSGGQQNQGENDDERDDANGNDMRVRPAVVWSPDSRSRRSCAAISAR